MSGVVRWERRVRYAECDQQGVVFNAHYLAWFDDSMTELMRGAFGGYEQLRAAGLDIVLGEARLAFRAPARFDEVVALEVAVERLGRSSLVCAHRVRRGEELVAEGETRHVFIGLAERSSVAAPGWVRAAFGLAG